MGVESVSYFRVVCFKIMEYMYRNAWYNRWWIHVYCYACFCYWWRLN